MSRSVGFVRDKNVLESDAIVWRDRCQAKREIRFGCGGANKTGRLQAQSGAEESSVRVATQEDRPGLLEQESHVLSGQSEPGQPWHVGSCVQQGVAWHRWLPSALLWSSVRHQTRSGHLQMQLHFSLVLFCKVSRMQQTAANHEMHLIYI